MIYFKSCGRCRGDVRLDSDNYGWFLQCLQCGFQRNLPAGLTSAPVYATARVEPVQRPRTPRQELYAEAV